MICFKETKICILKLDALFKQEAVLKLDPSEIQWFNSDQIEKFQKSSYVSVDQDGSTVIGDDTTTKGQSVVQKAGLDARQLKNLEKVLIPRGVVHRSLSLEVNAGDIVEVEHKKYVILTAAHEMRNRCYWWQCRFNLKALVSKFIGAVMNGFKKAKILSYDAQNRTAKIHIPGLTDGASTGLTATFAYPVGDSDKDTEREILEERMSISSLKIMSNRVLSSHSITVIAKVRWSIHAVYDKRISSF